MNPQELILKVANRFVRNSYWYNNILFPNCAKFNTRVFDLEVVNLGSTSALYAFDYEGAYIKAANWAMSPQSFVNDYAIISNYSSLLKNNACVLLPLCPFSCLGGGNDFFPDRYYSIVRPISIPNYSLVKRDEVRRMMNNPIMYYPLVAPLYSLRRNKDSMGSKEMEIDAQNRISSWKREFSIYNLNDEFSILNTDRYNDSVSAAKKLIKFCEDHGYSVKIVIPPLSKYLAEIINGDIKKRYIQNFVNDINTNNIDILDYMDSPMFKDDSMFRDSFLLNKKGAKLFTGMILNDIR